MIVYVQNRFTPLSVSTGAGNVAQTRRSVAPALARTKSTVSKYGAVIEVLAMWRATTFAPVGVRTCQALRSAPTHCCATSLVWMLSRPEATEFEALLATS